MSTEQTKHTPTPWRTGVTLVTSQTRKWTRKQVDENNAIERRIVFSRFSSLDAGKSRIRVCICDREEDAAYIAKLPSEQAALLKRVEELEAENKRLNQNHLPK